MQLIIIILSCKLTRSTCIVQVYCLVGDLTRCVECPSTAYGFEVLPGIGAQWRDFNACKKDMVDGLVHPDSVSTVVYCNISLARRTMNYIAMGRLPVKYRGTECVRNPPAATTQRLWRRRSISLALSGVS